MLLERFHRPGLDGVFNDSEAVRVYSRAGLLWHHEEQQVHVDTAQLAPSRFEKLVYIADSFGRLNNTGILHEVHCNAVH